MTKFLAANSTTAWYQDNFPGATMKPNCGVIHTTEGTSLPGYSSGATAPNYTAVPDFTQQRLRWYQHFPDEKSSRALVNAPGGVETNTANALQVELVGTCARGTRDAWKKIGAKFIFWPEPPTWALKDLARFIADMNVRHGIPINGPSDEHWKPYPESFGAGGQRFSFAEWRNFKGWCGHQHVPENVHGDPGNFPWSIIERTAKGMLDATQPTPRWDKLVEIAKQIQADNKSSTARHGDALAIQKLAAKHSTKH